jgi:hypothetical protein
MVAGIIFVALGLKKTIVDVSDSLGAIPSVTLSVVSPITF